jgi:hypothetical protein
LAAIRFVLLKDSRNVGIVEVEDLTKQEDCALYGRQSLHNQHESQRQGLVQLHLVRRLECRLGHHRLRQPLPHVLFTLNAGRLQVIET